MTREGKDFKELDEMIISLREFLEIYKRIKDGTRYSTPEILKNVQGSIKELCTLIAKTTAN